MKKLLIAVLVLCVGVHTAEASNILIAYFSRSGNTQKVAEYIQSDLSMYAPDMFRIQTVEAYPEDYEETTAKAKEEQNTNARPALANHVGDMSKYDVVFLGYPIWWGTVPMAVMTFLDSYDFSGKRIIPFNTHAGSFKGSSITDIRNAATGATVDDGFAVRGAEAETAGTIVMSWVMGLGLDRTETQEPDDNAGTETGTETQKPEDTPETEDNGSEETPTEDTTGTQPATTNNSKSGSSSSGCGVSGSALLLLCLVPCLKRTTKER